jgi:hypothetical protein
MHRHSYRRSGGCDGNPGVYLVGSGIMIRSACACGATREEYRPGPHDGDRGYTSYFAASGERVRIVPARR